MSFHKRKEDHRDWYRLRQYVVFTNHDTSHMIFAILIMSNTWFRCSWEKVSAKHSLPFHRKEIMDNPKDLPIQDSYRADMALNHFRRHHHSSHRRDPNPRVARLTESVLPISYEMYHDEWTRHFASIYIDRDDLLFFCGTTWPEMNNKYCIYEHCNENVG